MKTISKKNIWQMSSSKKITTSKKKKKKKNSKRNQKIEIGEFSILGWFDAPFPS